MIQATGTQLFTVPLPLEEGGLLGGAQVAYEFYGEPSDDNSVVLLHDLTHSHRAMGPVEPGVYRPSGWGTELIGSGKALDPVSAPIISVNLLGSPFGSTSPLSPDPETGEPRGTGLRDVTVLDMARAVSALLRAVGVIRARALVGVGLGGMVALRVAALFPELVSGVILIGSTHILPETMRERLGRTRQMLWSDPDFHGGRYMPGKPPVATLSKQRLEYLRLLYGREHLATRWPSLEAAERYLQEEADSFATTFDANTWALLCSAYVAADLTPVMEQLPEKQVLLIAGQTDVLAPPRRMLDTYHLLTAGGARTLFHELQGPGDHGMLLAEPRRLLGPVSDFLRRCP